jgi:hypothetical protein
MGSAFLALAAASLSSCASVPASAPAFTRAPAAPAGFQNVYIYRIGAYPTKRTPTIAVDGHPVFDPPETAYTVIHLAPGTHWVTTKWNWDAGAPPLSVPLEVTDKSVYYRLSGDFASAGFSWRIGTNLRGIPQDQAEAEMRKCCRYVAAPGWRD